MHLVLAICGGILLVLVFSLVMRSFLQLITSPLVPIIVLIVVVAGFLWWLRAHGIL